MPGGEWAAAVAFQYGGPGKVPAWKLEALTAHGQRPDQTRTGERWRRNTGSFEGLRFETTDHGPRPAARVRGRSDGPGERLRHSGRGDQWLSGGRLPGRIAARALVRKLRETGREVEADGLHALNDDRIDAADVLAVEVGERASIREHDGGLPRDESERKAWAARAVGTMKLGKRWRKPAPLLLAPACSSHKKGW